MSSRSRFGHVGELCHHFRNYAKEKIEYAIKRYVDECHRLYGVMNKRLEDREFLAVDYSIADMACIGWVRSYEGQGQDLNEFPNLKRWFDTMMARPGVQRGIAVGKDMHKPMSDEDKKILFNQRAR